MELIYVPLITIAFFIVLPFVAIPAFQEVSEKAKEHAERQKNLSKIELIQEQNKDK